MSVSEKERVCKFPMTKKQHCQLCQLKLKNCRQKHNSTHFYNICEICNLSRSLIDSMVNIEEVMEHFHTLTHPEHSYHLICRNKINLNDWVCSEHKLKLNKITLSSTYQHNYRHNYVDMLYYNILLTKKHDSLWENNYFHRENNIIAVFSQNKMRFSKLSDKNCDSFRLDMFLELPNEIQIIILKFLDHLEILLLFLLIPKLKKIIQYNSLQLIPEEQFLDTFIIDTMCANINNSKLTAKIRQSYPAMW